MKHISKIFLLFLPLLTSILASCTLMMNDIDVPEDLKGFGSEYTKKTPYGEATFEFQDNVKSVTENVLPYISHMENDSVLYYLESTPSDKLPKVGECLSASAFPVIPEGLNHRVLAVERVGGFYRVTTTPCSLEEVYKSLDAHYSIDVPVPCIVAVDSTMLDSLGITEADMTYVDWSAYSKVYPEMALPAARASRSWELFDVDLKDENVITILDLDTRKAFTMSNIKAIFDKAGELVEDEAKKEGWEFDGNIPGLYGRVYCLLTINSKIGLHIQLDPFLVETSLTAGADLKGGIEVGFGAGVSGSNEKWGAKGVELAAKVMDKLKSLRKKNTEAKLKPALPSVHIPIPAASPAVTATITPRFSLGASFAFGGYAEFTVPIEFKLGLAFGSDGIDKEKTYFQRVPKSTTTNSGVFGTAGLTVSGGIGFGIAAVKVCKVEMTMDLEGNATATKTFSESTGFANNKNFSYKSAYTPDKNCFSVGLDGVIGLDLKVGKKSYPWELFRKSLVGHRWYQRPCPSDFSYFNLAYNDDTNNINQFSVNLAFDDNGMGDYKKSTPAVVVAPRNSVLTPQVFVYGNSISQGKELSTDHNYIIDCVVPECEEGFEISPAIVSTKGDVEIINGSMQSVPGNANAFEVKNVKHTVAVTGRGNNLSYKVTDYLSKKYPSLKDKLANYFYYSWVSKMDILGGPNIKKWGLHVTVLSNINAISSSDSQVVFEKDYDIEDSSNGAISSGTKTVRFEFLDDTVPTTAFDDITPYTVYVRPYYYTNKGVRKQLHSKTIQIGLGANDYNVWNSADRTLDASN